MLPERVPGIRNSRTPASAAWASRRSTDLFLLS
jgi:hypothetical protein